MTAITRPGRLARMEIGVGAGTKSPLSVVRASLQNGNNEALRRLSAESRPGRLRAAADRETGLRDRAVRQAGRHRLRTHPGYRAIQRIPGVGPTLGTVPIAEIGDVTRSPDRHSWPQLGRAGPETPRVRPRPPRTCRSTPARGEGMADSPSPGPVHSRGTGARACTRPPDHRHPGAARSPFPALNSVRRSASASRTCRPPTRSSLRGDP